jgi:hypothetical protein
MSFELHNSLASFLTYTFSYARVWMGLRSTVDPVRILASAPRHIQAFSHLSIDKGWPQVRFSFLFIVEISQWGHLELVCMYGSSIFWT